MKKIFVSLLLIGSFGFQLHSANTENVIRQFSESKDVYRIRIGRVGVFLLKIFNSDAESRSYAKGLKSLEISTLKDNCTKEKKDKYQDNLRALQDDENYATLLTVKDGNDNVRIMMKKEKDVIRELIIIVCDTEDIALIRMKGKIKESDLGTTIAQFDKKR